MGGLRAAKTHINHPEVPWLKPGMGIWGEGYGGKMHFAVPVGSHARNLQRKMDVPHSHPCTLHRGNPRYITSAGQRFEAFVNQHWTNTFFFEHVVFDTTDQIRPIKSYLVPAPGDIQMWSRWRGLGERSFCPAHNQAIFKSTGLYENTDGVPATYEFGEVLRERESYVTTRRPISQKELVETRSTTGFR